MSVKEEVLFDEFAFHVDTEGLQQGFKFEGRAEFLTGLEEEESAPELERAVLRWNARVWETTPEERYAREVEIIRLRVPQREAAALRAAEMAKHELLPAGTRVVVLVRHSWHWCLVELEDGRRRWVQEAALEDCAEECRPAVY